MSPRKNLAKQGPNPAPTAGLPAQVPLPNRLASACLRFEGQNGQNDPTIDWLGLQNGFHKSKSILPKKLIISDPRKSAKMPPILAILFILLGTFLNGIFANQPGIVLFKIVANNKSNLKIEHVRILQNRQECCKQAILIPTNLNESKQFMVDWKQFPAGEMKEASDLKKIKFQVQFGFGNNAQMFWIGLENRSDHLLSQLFGGGQANILIGREYKHNDIIIKYVEAKQGNLGQISTRFPFFGIFSYFWL